jgi:hypothetical protein
MNTRMINTVGTRARLKTISSECRSIQLYVTILHGDVDRRACLVYSPPRLCRHLGALLATALQKRVRRGKNTPVSNSRRRKES